MCLKSSTKQIIFYKKAETDQLLIAGLFQKVSGLKLGEEQPNSATKVRLWVRLSCQRPDFTAVLRQDSVKRHRRGIAKADLRFNKTKIDEGTYRP